MSKKSGYIKYSRTLVRKLYTQNKWGKGSMYEDNLLTGVPDKSVAKEVLKALVRQKIILKKKKIRGEKYYLNTNKREKIGQIAKEKGRKSIIPMLLLL